MTEQTDRKLIATGVVGTVIAALCCFTPVLVVLLGAVGLSAWLGWLDYVLLPALAFFRRADRVRGLAAAAAPDRSNGWIIS